MNTRVFEDFYKPFISSDQFSRLQRFNMNLAWIQIYRSRNDLSNVALLESVNETIRDEITSLLARLTKLQDGMSIKGNIFHQLAMKDWKKGHPLSFTGKKNKKLHSQSDYEFSVRLLLWLKLDPNEKDNIFKQTSLMSAIALDNVPCALALLRFPQFLKLDMHCSTEWGENTALLMAIQRGQAEVIARLIQVGADVNGADKYGLTPLHWAVIMADAKTTALLLTHENIKLLAAKNGRFPQDYVTITESDLAPPRGVDGAWQLNSTTCPEFRPIVAHFWGEYKAFLSYRNLHLDNVDECKSMLDAYLATEKSKEVSASSSCMKP